MNDLNLREFPNIIDLEYQNKLWSTVTDIAFPWHYLEDTTFERAGKASIATPGFTHLLFKNDSEQSKYLDIFTPLYMKILEEANLELTSTIRLRLGFLLKTRYNLPNLPYAYNSPHVDCETDHYTALYYLNETDGNTVIFRETEKSEKYTIDKTVTPNKGKAVVFNGKYYHASTCPKMNPSRVVLTINFTAKEK